MVDDKLSLEFEARYYMAEARRLQQQGMRLIRESDDMLEHAVNTWNRAKEVTAG
jgi:hypothetical protein